MTIEKVLLIYKAEFVGCFLSVFTIISGPMQNKTYKTLSLVRRVGQVQDT